SSALARCVQEQVETGAYEAPGEVVREALELLQERQEIRRLRLERLRQEIQAGIDQLDRGESAPLDIEAIKAEARRQRQERQTALEPVRSDAG
ncbi:MAG TPA: type II toxin-antitoxin system ParD family antitoxin, partial [Planctomycetaceae bacterium]|nr:type II toxin-antitoxin system ParD family antitoxin [Planctomycetaceae bacterium]